MPTSATSKLNARKEPKKVVLENDFAGIKAGQRMLVGTPKMVDNYLRKIPFGEKRTVQRLRNELARRHRCDAMCPVSTAIFLRIAAEAALEAMQDGTPVSKISPFWRVINADDKVAGKLNISRDWISHQQALEQKR